VVCNSRTCTPEGVTKASGPVSAAAADDVGGAIGIGGRLRFSSRAGADTARVEGRPIASMLEIP
jgi:hypothetical protein